MCVPDSNFSTLCTYVAYVSKIDFYKGPVWQEVAPGDLGAFWTAIAGDVCVVAWVHSCPEHILGTCCPTHGRLHKHNLCDFPEQVEMKNNNTNMEVKGVHKQVAVETIA